MIEPTSPDIVPTRSFYTQVGKPALDFCIALSFLILLSPVMFIIAILVKTTSAGPIFFKQERLGLNEQVFKIYKFRTMCVNAEFQGDGIFARDRHDTRITKVGRILRKTSLDELPQLINIVRGEMALVGPRPPVTYHPYKRGAYGPVKAHRFDVRPGMTGLAQAEIRNTGTWDERIGFDVRYVQDVTLLGDISILLKTVKTVAKLDQ